MLAGTLQRPCVVPSGLVEHHDRVRVLRNRLGKLGQERAHGGGRHTREHQGEVLACRGLHAGKDVGRLKALVGDPRRALPAHPPAVRGPALLADAGLVHEPERDLLVRMSLGGRPHGIEEPLFANASAALASRFGCTGRAFCLESPRRRTTRDKSTISCAGLTRTTASPVPGRCRTCAASSRPGSTSGWARNRARFGIYF